MPISKEGKEVLANMLKQYGKTKGKAVFYALGHKHKEWFKGKHK